MTPREILQRAQHVLLDFDGPVCAVFGRVSDHAVAHALRIELADAGLSYPADLDGASDPFEVLAFAARADPEVAVRVERRFEECEISAVQGAPATTGTPELLRRAATVGQLVTIVSNNSTRAVQQYLKIAGLAGLVRSVAGRDGAKVEHLKPSPYLLQQAMEETGTPPEECVMVGDSSTDIEAARAAGTKVIAFANKPGKASRLATLEPDGLVVSMTEL